MHSRSSHEGGAWNSLTLSHLHINSHGACSYKQYLDVLSSWQQTSWYKQHIPLCMFLFIVVLQFLHQAVISVFPAAISYRCLLTGFTQRVDRESPVIVQKVHTVSRFSLMTFGNIWAEYKDSTYHDEYMARNTGVFGNQSKIINGNSVQYNMRYLNAAVIVTFVVKERRGN